MDNRVARKYFYSRWRGFGQMNQRRREFVFLLLGAAEYTMEFGTLLRLGFMRMGKVLPDTTVLAIFNDPEFKEFVKLSAVTPDGDVMYDVSLQQAALLAGGDLRGVQASLDVRAIFDEIGVDLMAAGADPVLHGVADALKIIFSAYHAEDRLYLAVVIGGILATRRDPYEKRLPPCALHLTEVGMQLKNREAVDACLAWALPALRSESSFRLARFLAGEDFCRYFRVFDSPVHGSDKVAQLLVDNVWADARAVHADQLPPWRGVRMLSFPAEVAQQAEGSETEDAVARVLDFVLAERQTEGVPEEGLAPREAEAGAIGALEEVETGEAWRGDLATVFDKMRREADDLLSKVAEAAGSGGESPPSAGGDVWGGFGVGEGGALAVAVPISPGFAAEAPGQNLCPEAEGEETAGSDPFGLGALVELDQNGDEAARRRARRSSPAKPPTAGPPADDLQENRSAIRVESPAVESAEFGSPGDARREWRGGLLQGVPDVASVLRAARGGRPLLPGLSVGSGPTNEILADAQAYSPSTAASSPVGDCTGGVKLAEGFWRGAHLSAWCSLGGACPHKFPFPGAQGLEV
eukprot:evm.model.scf_89.6 EVM.evm.TU.scf_89.6   scf_89:22731-24767(+)